MSGKSGFGVTISATDEASAKIDAFNKRIQALNAPAERFNKSMAKFGEVTGITRVAEGVKGLGDKSLETARAMERMVSPMALLTSGASIAGVAELTRRWGDAGNSISRASYVLNEPVAKLSALQIAARLAGASTEGMNSGLASLNEHLRAVAYHREAPTLLNQLGIDAGSPGHVTDVATALGQLADHIKALREPGAQQRALDLLGMSDLLPLLKDGKKGLDDFIAAANRTGGVMTDKMAADAKQLHTAWERIGADIEGVTNRLIDKYEPAVKHILDQASNWIEKNSKTADSIASIGTAIGALLALKPAAWILRLLGLGFVGSVGAAVAGEEMLYYGTRIGDAGPSQSEEDRLSNYPGRNDGRDRAPLAGPRVGSNGGRAGPVGTTADRSMTVEERSLLDALAGGESTGSYSARNPAGAYGRYQFIPSTRNSLLREMGLPSDTPLTPDLQDRMALRLAREHGWRPGMTADEAARLLNSTWVSLPGGSEENTSSMTWQQRLTNASQAERAADSGTAPNSVPPTGPLFGPQNLGHVRVDIHHHNAPTGTTSTATGTGAVMVTPPRIETSVPGFGAW